MSASSVLSPTVYNVTLTDAGTEYSQALPDGCKHFSIQCRTAFDVRFAFETGKVATPTAPYATVKSGGAYTSPEKLCYDGTGTLYLASSQAAVVVEIVAWS